MCAQANTGTVLDRILESRRAEVEHRKKVLPETALKYGVKAATPLRDFTGALTRPGMNIMAELKPPAPRPFRFSPNRNFSAARSRTFATREKAFSFPSCARILSLIHGRCGRHG